MCHRAYEGDGRQGVTNAELQALELQARIMGWAPATVWDAIVEVPAARPVAASDLMYAYMKARGLLSDGLGAAL